MTSSHRSVLEVYPSQELRAYCVRVCEIQEEMFLAGKLHYEPGELL